MTQKLAVVPVADKSKWPCEVDGVGISNVQSIDRMFLIREGSGKITRDQIEVMAHKAACQWFGVNITDFDKASYRPGWIAAMIAAVREIGLEVENQ